MLYVSVQKQKKKSAWNTKEYFRKLESQEREQKCGKLQEVERKALKRMGQGMF